MVVGKLSEGPSLDSEAERARLARLAEKHAQEAQEAAKREAEAKAAAERAAAEEARKAEQARVEAERKAAEEKAAAEKKAAEARAAEEQKQAEIRAAEEKKQAEIKAAEQAAAAKKAEEDRIAEEKRKQAALIEAERVAEEKRVAEKKRRDEEAAADKARREEEEKRKMAEAMADMERINELPDPPILFDTFGEMGLKLVSHRENRVIEADENGVKVVVACCNLDRTRMLIKLEREDKSVVGEHAVMCTMSYSAALGPHFVAEAVIPEPGEYSLKFFCNNEAGKTGYQHVATYNVTAATASKRAGQRFPKLHPAVPMALIEPLCDEIAAGSSVEFKVVLGPGVTTAQVATADGKRVMLTEKASGEMRIASGVATVVKGTENEGNTSIICQKDGEAEWVVFTKFSVA